MGIIPKAHGGFTEVFQKLKQKDSLEKNPQMKKMNSEDVLDSDNTKNSKNISVQYYNIWKKY